MKENDKGRVSDSSMPKTENSEKRSESHSRRQNMHNKKSIMISEKLFEVTYEKRYFTTEMFIKQLDVKIVKLNTHLSVDNKNIDQRFSKLPHLSISDSQKKQIIFEFKVKLRENTWT